MILRCTAKFAKLLGAKTMDTTPADKGDWYVNLIYLERRKCLLITHAGTLFTVLAADVHKADLVPVGEFVAHAIHRELLAEDLAPDTFGNLVKTDVTLAKSASRSVLGRMNEMAYHCRYVVMLSGGFQACDFWHLNHELRRTLHAPRGYARPIDVVRQQTRSADEHEPGRILQLRGPAASPANVPFRKAR